MLEQLNSNKASRSSMGRAAKEFARFSVFQSRRAEPEKVLPNGPLEWTSTGAQLKRWRQQARPAIPVKLYLDTNLVSAIVREDHPLEADALTEIVRRGADGEFNLVTSKVTGDEIDRCKGPHAPAIQNLYDSMKKLPYVEYEVHVGFDSYWDDEMGGWSNPLYDVDPSWSSLRAAGLDETDAHHIMLALKGGCNFFLTCDVRTILRRRQKIEAQHNIRLLKPSECLGQLH